MRYGEEVYDRVLFPTELRDSLMSVGLEVKENTARRHSTVEKKWG